MSWVAYAIMLIYAVLMRPVSQAQCGRHKSISILYFIWKKIKERIYIYIPMFDVNREGSAAPTNILKLEVPF